MKAVRPQVSTSKDVRSPWTSSITLAYVFLRQPRVHTSEVNVRFLGLPWLCPSSGAYIQGGTFSLDDLDARLSEDVRVILGHPRACTSEDARHPSENVPHGPVVARSQHPRIDATPVLDSSSVHWHEHQCSSSLLDHRCPSRNQLGHRHLS